MPAVIESIRSLLGRLELGLAAISGAILLFMMTLTAADVVLRYFVSAPIGNAFELTELALAMLIFTGLPIVSLRGAHVTTDLVDKFIPLVARERLQRAVDALCGVVLFGVAVIVHQKAQVIGDAGDRTPVSGIPLAPFIHAIAVMVFVTALIHVLRSATSDSARSGAEAL